MVEIVFTIPLLRLLGALLLTSMGIGSFVYQIANGIKLQAVKRGSGRPVAKTYTFLKFNIFSIVSIIISILLMIENLIDELPFNPILQLSAHVVMGVGSAVIVVVVASKK